MSVTSEKQKDTPVSYRIPEFTGRRGTGVQRFPGEDKYGTLRCLKNNLMQYQFGSGYPPCAILATVTRASPSRKKEANEQG
ncbi:MAG: hypothetical protein WKG03_18260 [Telluria sp.]